MPLNAPERGRIELSIECLRRMAFSVLVALCVGLGTLGAHAADNPSFFDTNEIKSTSMDAFKKWNEALERYTREKAAAKKGKCGDKELNTCNFDKWIKFLKETKDKDPVSQIRAINDYMNRAPYITDPVNWGKKDFWATPGEFMAKFGDCEDYAIAKYMSLRLLGYSDDELRVVAVKDLNLKIGHAILVVFFKGKPYVLDNQIKQVVPTSKIKHYLPVFSINQTAWWKHIPAG